MVAWYSPIWFKETILGTLLWLASPLTAMIARAGTFKSYALQQSLKELSEITQVGVIKNTIVLNRYAKS